MKHLRSCRRILLNHFIESYKSEFRGDTLDIGGVKDTQRIDVQINSLPSVKKYQILNNSSQARPDIVMDANDLKLSENSYDTIVCYEVLEYLNDPKNFIAKSYALLKPGGKLYLSLPLHHTVHGDFEHDKWRVTESGLRFILEQNNIKKFAIYPMGGLLSVIFDLIFAHLSFNKMSSSLCSKVKMKLLLLSQRVVLTLDKASLRNSKKLITTGYFVRIEKNV